MLRFLLTFATATVACVVVYVLRCRLAGEGRFSAPFGAVVPGFAAAAIGHFVGSPLAAAGVVGLYALASWAELREEARLREEAARRVSGRPAAGPGPGGDGPSAG